MVCVKRNDGKDVNWLVGYNIGVPAVMSNATTTGTILIVDDDEGVTQTFARMLRLEGYQVRTAISAETGLREAEQNRPDAIILDLRMPLVDGLGSCGTSVRKTISARRLSRSSPAITSSTTPCRPNCTSWARSCGSSRCGWKISSASPATSSR